VTFCKTVGRYGAKDLLNLARLGTLSSVSRKEKNYENIGESADRSTPVNGQNPAQAPSNGCTVVAISFYQLVICLLPDSPEKCQKCQKFQKRCKHE